MALLNSRGQSCDDPNSYMYSTIFGETNVVILIECCRIALAISPNTFASSVSEINIFITLVRSNRFWELFSLCLRGDNFY